MYMHIDGPLPGGRGGGYSLARVGVAVCDTVDGDYKYLKSFRPLGHESRDIGQFVDDDGAAYLIFEDRPNGFHIARAFRRLFDSRKGSVPDPDAHGRRRARRITRGFITPSVRDLTGWNPNPNRYATAKSLEGPWSEFKDIAPPAPTLTAANPP